MILPNIKIKLNSRTWMTEVFSSDFLVLKNLCSLIDLSGLCNLTGHYDLYSPVSSKKLHDGLISPGTKMTNTSPFMWNGFSKIQFFTNI
jgi:hypothetical protein